MNANKIRWGACLTTDGVITYSVRIRWIDKKEDLISFELRKLNITPAPTSIKFFKYIFAETEHGAVEKLLNRTNNKTHSKTVSQWLEEH